jgi:hypothetical protein
MYTNVDIALMPHLYLAVHQIIAQGIDAFVINRRTIPNTFSGIDELPLMYASPGEKHPGYDCFIFSRRVYPEYNFGTACVGANWIGRVIIANLICHAANFHVFEDVHLTFHIGDEKTWRNPAYREYDQHNEDELYHILLGFQEQGLVKGKPLVEKFLKQIEYKQKKFTFYSQGNLPQNPIFVVGYPRSGTTLLQALLATQDNIYSFPETQFFYAHIYGLLQTTNNGLIEPACLDAFFAELRESVRLFVPWNEIDYFKELAATEQFCVKQLFEYIIKHYLSEQVDIGQLSAIRWLEKSPNHALALDTMYNLYPYAQFIAIVRNPLAAILSRKQSFSKDYSFKFLAERWRDTIQALDRFRQSSPHAIVIIRYEDLVLNPAGVLSEVCDFLAIPFNADRLQNLHDVARHVIRPFETWKKKLRERKIVKDTNEKHFNQLALTDILKIQNIVKEEMKVYGYSLHYPIYQRIYDRLAKVKHASYTLGKRYQESV